MAASLRALAHHAVEVGRGDFGRDRALDRCADFGDHLLDRPAGLGDQRRVGGDAVEQAGRGELADFGNVGGVDKEFHVQLLSDRWLWALAIYRSGSFSGKRAHRRSTQPNRVASSAPIRGALGEIRRAWRQAGSSPCWCRSPWPAPYTYRVPDGLPSRPATSSSVPLGTRDVVGVVWDDPPDPRSAHNRLRAIAGQLRRAAAVAGDPRLRRLGGELHADLARHGAAHGAARARRAAAGSADDRACAPPDRRRSG